MQIPNSSCSSGNQTTTDSLIDAYAQQRIEFRLGRVAKKFCLSREDVEDLRQDFLLALVKAGPRFDPSKTRRKTYISAVLDRRYKHHVRQMLVREEYSALKPTPLEDVDPEVTEQLPDAASERDFLLADLEMDFPAILSQMPPKLREVCQAVMNSSNPQQAARELGVDPGTISRLLQRIRPYFVRAGYDPLS